MDRRPQQKEVLYHNPADSTRGFFREQEKQINKQQKDISSYNRIHSISEDCEFVSLVAKQFSHLPIIANQRCGAWYVDPDTSPNCSVYFKSTDGHDGQWQFSLRRSNLHLVNLIVIKHGVLIVDSTRRGKRFPDALSKTIPAWCAVLNLARIMLGDQYPIADEDLNFWSDHKDIALLTPPNAVRESEHDQIREKIGFWAEELLASSYDFRRSIAQLKRPLRPMWCCPMSLATMHSEPNLSANNLPPYYSVVCVSASKLLSDNLTGDGVRNFSYVQGAGDDHEAWSEGLTPTLFWKHKTRILSASRHDLPQLLHDIFAAEALTRSASSLPHQTFIIPRTGLGITLADGWQELDTKQPLVGSLTVLVSMSSRQIHHIKEGDKTATSIDIQGDLSVQKNVDQILSHSVPICLQTLRDQKDLRLIAGGSDAHQSRELVIAIALCVLVEAFDDTALLRINHTPRIDKGVIRSRLQWMIEASEGKLNPPRSMLKRVNNYLIPPP